MACTGIEFCKLAIVETKSARADLIAELEQRFPDLDTPITVNVNGCPNSCARIQVADIGLKGQLVLDADGNQVEGFQVHLGGGLGLDAAVRPEAARPQGHQHRPRRLRHQRGHRVPATSARTTRRFAAWVGPRRRRRAARRGRQPRAGGGPMSGARHPVPLPLLRRREPPPQRGGRTAPGSAAPACAPSR